MGPTGRRQGMRSYHLGGQPLPQWTAVWMRNPGSLGGRTQASEAAAGQPVLILINTSIKTDTARI